MTREEEIQKASAEIGEPMHREGRFIHEIFCAAAKWADAHPVNPWHKASEELPPIDTEVVCKMKGVPYTEHFICKWDGEFWWKWEWLNQDAQGWFGLNNGWEIVEWKEI